MPNIITLDAYKEYAAEKSPTGDDTLQVIINYASSLVEAYCNTSFSPVSVAGKRLTVMDGEYELVLPNAPIISLDELKTVSEGVVVETVDLTKCYLEDDVGIVTLPYDLVLPQRKANVQVSYTYGYSTPPPAVVLACYELVTYLYKREYVKSKSVDGQNANYPDTKVLPVHIKTALDLFKVL